MKKFRHRDQLDLRDENLKRVFPWIDWVKPIYDFMPGAYETWSIKLRGDIVTIPRGREELEDFIKSFFIGKMRRKGVIFCWRHMGVVIIVL